MTRARGLNEDLRTWCKAETNGNKDVAVGEVGLDLIANQRRLVAHSIFDVLSGRDF